LDILLFVVSTRIPLKISAFYLKKGFLRSLYNDKVACYTTAYIITNIPLYEQYPQIQQTQPEMWNAFLRRIHVVYDFNSSETVPISKTLAGLHPLTEKEQEELGF